VPYELADADWHWRSGACPNCHQPASFRPLTALNGLDKLYEKRLSLGEMSNRDREQLDALHASRFTCLLEDVRSLFNVGSILRTADGAGAGAVFLSGVTGCPPHRQIAKASLGAEESVAWQYHLGAIAILRELKRVGVQIVGLESTKESVLLSQAITEGLLHAPVCLVVGNEVMGLSAETSALCDIVCHLPMRGMKESLNVAVAFGIASYMIVEALGHK
jgi:tRNA G18 (ribose-2'-O)-methylase SpoU